MLFTDIERCSIKECPQHDCILKMRFRYQCDMDWCDRCTSGYNCKRCRNFEACADGAKNAAIQAEKRRQLNEWAKAQPKADPRINIQMGL